MATMSPRLRDDDTHDHTAAADAALLHELLRARLEVVSAQLALIDERLRASEAPPSITVYPRSRWGLYRVGSGRG